MEKYDEHIFHESLNNTSYVRNGFASFLFLHKRTNHDNAVTENEVHLVFVKSRLVAELRLPKVGWSLNSDYLKSVGRCTQTT